MDTQFQPSFIPKKPVTGSSRDSRSGGGVFYYISVLIFSAAILASVGVWGYEYYLNSKISKMENDLSVARTVLQPDLIKELSKANKRFLSAEEILKNHITLSNFFNVLEEITLQNVRFNAFSYTVKTEGIVVVMKGEARTYANVALQAKIFSENDAFMSALFSDLDLNEDGNVVFTVKATLNPEVISYKAMYDLQSTSVAPVSNVESTGTTTQVQTATSTATSSPIQP